MKHQYLATMFGVGVIALIASSVWTDADAITFTPNADNSTPSKSTGGASRGTFFTPSADNSTPSQSTGGASRGIFFTPQAGKGTPRSSAGASRSSLLTKGTPQQAKSATQLIALLPQSFYGTTVSERPTILVYIPASNAEEAVFSLKNEAGNMQHQMTIPIAGKTGVIAVKLPANAPALAVGKNYQWLLAVKVDGQLSPSTPYVDGWIQRIQPSADLARAMQHKDALKRAEALGKNGVWYDCVATLAALHTAQPTDAELTKQWKELLSSVGLKALVTDPLVASAN